MKKIAALALGVALAFTLTACGGSNSSSSAPANGSAAASGPFKEVLTQLKADGTKYSAVARTYQEYAKKNFGTLAVTVSSTFQTDGKDSPGETLTGVNWYDTSGKDASLGRIYVREIDSPTESVYKIAPNIYAAFTEGDSGVSYKYYGVNTTANTIAVSASKMDMPLTGSAYFGASADDNISDLLGTNGDAERTFTVESNRVVCKQVYVTNDESTTIEAELYADHLVSTRTSTGTHDGKVYTGTTVVTMAYSKAATADEVKALMAPFTTDLVTVEQGSKEVEGGYAGIIDKFNTVFKKYL